jgi:hypothetical protein
MTSTFSQSYKIVMNGLLRFYIRRNGTPQQLPSSVQNRTTGGKLPSVQAVDFGPYCSRSDRGGLAFNLDLLLAAGSFFKPPQRPLSYPVLLDWLQKLLSV